MAAVCCINNPCAPQVLVLSDAKGHLKIFHNLLLQKNSFPASNLFMNSLYHNSRGEIAGAWHTEKKV